MYKQVETVGFAGPLGSYPALPLREIVVFPNMIVPLFVGRKQSIASVESAIAQGNHIVLVSQKNSADEEPEFNDLYHYGTFAQILQLLKLPDGTMKLLVEGMARVKIYSFESKDGHYLSKISMVDSSLNNDIEVEALARSVLASFGSYVQLNKKISPEVFSTVSQLDDYAKLADTIASHLFIKIFDKQSILEKIDLKARLERLLSIIENELAVLEIENNIKLRVKNQMEKTQREYYLNEQMKAIQKELSDSEDGLNDIAALQDKIKHVALSKEARAKAESELRKLRSMAPMSAEAAVIRNYLDTLLNLPWGSKVKLKRDLGAAQAILDAEHYGLELVKERILEHLAVQSRANKIKGPILCLVGPPGVGKTSIAKSIAHATGRVFAKMALGGVRDEADIRGHRRTYIGAMPGKILQSLAKVKKNNPLLLLDEIDKLSQDFRGDPAAALLEVLDPEQNNKFVDHYLEVEYDLSDIMFITTANSLDISAPLLDRLEIITLSGYTEDEKMAIATKYLLPRALADHSIKSEEVVVEEEVIRDLIRYYTREAGVRDLQRQLMALVRKALTKIMKGEVKQIRITSADVVSYIGTKKYEFGLANEKAGVGLVSGLAWTRVGGELLTIEALSMPGKGKMLITGNLKDVMKESISAAASFVRANALRFGIDPALFQKNDIHVHVPEGATPKDGPSAGIAMTTAIVSVLTSIPVRPDLAMTGEVTLRGRVLPIGGLKEKLMGALRGGIKTVIIPHGNIKDLADVSDKIKNNLEIIPVSYVEEVLDLALMQSLTPISSNNELVNLDESGALFSVDDYLHDSSVSH